jgi:hypothetical protein
MAKESRAFGSQRGHKTHLTLGKGGVAGEVEDLRSDVEEGFQNLEERASYPELDYIDGTGPSAAGADMVLVGRNLLQGQSFDSLALWLGTSMVTITCLKPGDSPFTIQITDGASAGAEVVTKTGNAFVIQIEATVSTADQIATAINANGADSDGYLRAASGGGGQVNAIAAAASMSGGEGDFDGNKVMVGGNECLPANTPGTAGAAAWTDTGITVTVPALTPIVATDVAQVTVSSDGTRADAIGATVQA